MRREKAVMVVGYLLAPGALDESLACNLEGFDISRVEDEEYLREWMAEHFADKITIRCTKGLISGFEAHDGENACERLIFPRYCCYTP